MSPITWRGVLYPRDGYRGRSFWDTGQFFVPSADNEAHLLCYRPCKTCPNSKWCKSAKDPVRVRPPVEGLDYPWGGAPPPLEPKRLEEECCE